MGRSRLILVAVAMLAATSFSPFVTSVGASAPVDHAPVSIEGNANFTAANGVVSGSGASGDPFIIAGWHFATTASATAFSIRNATVDFVIRNNTFEAGTDLTITNSSGVMVVTNNSFVMRSNGVIVTRADAHVVSNSFIGDSASGGRARAVVLESSSSVVEVNAFVFVQYAVIAQHGGPSILCNDMHDDAIVAGITLTFTVDATVGCNVMTRCNAAIEVELSIRTLIVNNTIDNCGLGIHLHLDKDFVAVNNTIRASWTSGVSIDTSTGNFTGNVILDSAVNGVIIFRSPILFANNTVSNNLNIGVIVSETSGDVNANIIARNSVGLSLQGGAIPHVRANVMTNNTIGIDLPYASRQAIVNLSANLVNGVNIDGTITASQQVYFYRAANVQITGQVRDSGFSAGFFGSLTAQGNVVLYEVDTAYVNASVISHATFGVNAINSFNVVVDGDLIAQTGVGVFGAAVNVTVAGGVPPCAVAVKNTNITIPVDPTATVGIDLHACFGIVRNSTVSLVETGVRFDQASSGIIETTAVSNTTIGFDLSGSRPLSFRGNVATFNAIGARFTASRANVTANAFSHNSADGVQLYADSELAFNTNLVASNARGVIDMQDCSARTSSGAAACSSLVATGNVVSANGGVGLEIHGSSRFTGDIFSSNGADGAHFGAVTLTHVNASANGNTGARITGDFVIRDSAFTRNTRHGLDAQGGGEIRHSNLTFNGDAGVHFRATYVQMFDDNVSFNFDGILFDEDPMQLLAPPPSNTFGLNYILGLSPGQGNGPDPLDVHRSVLVGNERDAIRAGLAAVNATSDYWGGDHPAISVADQVGAFQNGVSASVRFIPWYADPQLTQSEPVPLL